MKSLLFATAIVLSSFALQVSADPAPSPNPAPEQKEVTVSISGAYIPGGFDSTSDVFVVVNGIFPNGCYKWSRAEVTHPSQYLHEVRSIANVSQGMCLMVLVPFNKEIHIGQIGSGNHKIRMINGDGTYLEKDLSIEK